MSNKLLIEKLASTENVNLSLNEIYEVPLSREISNYNLEKLLTWKFNVSFPVSCSKIKIDIEAIKNDGYVLSTSQNYFTLKTESQELCSFENFLGNYYNKKDELKITESIIVDFTAVASWLVAFTSESSKELLIHSIKITPIQEITSTEIEYKGELIQLENGSNKYIVKIYNKNNEDITKKCTFKWYYYKNQWIQEDNQDTSYGYFTEESPEGLAVC